MDQVHARSNTRTVIACVGLGVVYIAASAAMIESNKWMMRSNTFPYATVLTMLHMAMSSLLSFGFYRCCPSWFTAMRTLKVDIWLVVKFLPIGIASAGSIVLSNEAYKFLSVSVIQMLKETNIVMVFIISVMLGLMKFTRTATLLLLFIAGGAVLATYGTIEIMLFGLIIQLVSQIFEVTKIVSQNVLMNARGMKLDPLTLVLFMAPVCLGFSVPLCFVMVSDEWGDVLERGMKIWPALLLNCLLAFSLNIIVAMQIWLFNGVGFLIAAIMKDITIVTVAGCLFAEVITELQLVGFTTAILGVFGYSLYRMNESHFADDNIFNGFVSVFCDFVAAPKQAQRAD